jgi:hypothetical protein
MQIDAATAAAIAAIVAAIVSGFFALFSQWLERKSERKKERESVRAGIRAEIQAILDIAKRRDYIASLSNFINKIKDGSTNLFERRIAKDYDIVFRSNCGKLGLLPPETVANTVRFYYMVSSIVEDLVLLQEASEKPSLRTRYGLNTQAGNQAFHEDLLQLSVETVELGNNLIREYEVRPRKARRGVDLISDE